MTHGAGLGSRARHDISAGGSTGKGAGQRERIAHGIDPLELKRADRAAQRQAEARQHTFRQAAEACYAALEPGWSSTHHADEFIRSLERYAFPIIGNDDIAGLDKHSVLRVLEQKLPSRIKGADGGTLWHQRTVTADRVRSRIERVISFSEARGWRPEGTPNPARWRGFLDLILAAPRKIAPVRHMRAAPYAELPAVMAALSADPSVAAQALRFIILTGGRLGEAIKATWDEIDLAAAEWTIPAERMKSRREHRVPLCPPAVELLRSLYREEGNSFLFISTRTPGGAVAESTLGIALRNAGCTATIHGFRSCLKTWAEEQTNFPGLVIELCLAHRVGSAVENSYRRGADLIVKRRKLMEQWARFVTSPPVADAGKVLTMRRQEA